VNYLRFPLPHLLAWALLASSNQFASLSAVNGAVQMLLFAFVVCLPLWRTGRMGYVDIGWPWGVFAIGVVTMLMSKGYSVRVTTVGVVYMFVGARMGAGALVYWWKGWLDKELPRYLYQRLRWRETDVRHERLMAQIEVLSQGLANASFLAAPAFVIASNPAPSLSPWEAVGLALFASGYVIESVADSQKMLFIHRMNVAGEKNRVCDVGLWRYSRHPNYFGEWLVWLGLVVAALPSWLALRDQESTLTWVLLGLMLLYIARLMYWVLNIYSGALPAEHYSAQKRPDYAAYQRKTNMFFPGPPRRPRRA